jgi:hypothetical protein
MIINEQKILKQVAKAYANAKDGSLKVNDIKYSFTFDTYQGIYTVLDQENNEITRFNTRKLSQAKQWLKDYLVN